MANRAGRRRFGWIRKLPSGRYQASYWGPDGQRHNAAETFPGKPAAERWLSLVETQLLRGEWLDPERGKIPLGEYGRLWIRERPGLRVRTVDLYTWLFARYLEPALGQVRLNDIGSATVRSWRAGLLAAGVSESMTAKAYRLLRAILNTAVDDGFIARNPCRLKGAGSELAPERPVLSVGQVFDLIERMPARYRVLVLVATFASLRFGEVTAVSRADVDQRAGTIRVRRSWTERSTGEMVLGPPKSRAGTRSVALPRVVMDAVAAQLQEFSGEGPDALLFSAEKGGPIRRSNFNKQTSWTRAVAEVGVPGLHFHDLRHTGNVLAAGTPGVSLRDLMQRMGHDSMRAALIYQHASRDADRQIADALSLRIQAEKPAGQEAANSTLAARDGHRTAETGAGGTGAGA